MTESQTETVRKMAELARLASDEDEARASGAQFATILEHFQILARLPAEGVEPMTAPTRSSNVLRDDVPAPSLSPDTMLADAPQRIDDFYGVPKTVGGDE
jgi:aspartyl-tRNA(Asn)/glutamyl-tRNA(Gln) amidotransferase subunit C